MIFISETSGSDFALTLGQQKRLRELALKIQILVRLRHSHGRRIAKLLRENSSDG